MSTKTAEIAKMIDMLPDSDKELAYELIRKLVLAWDPDYTKVTEQEYKDCLLYTSPSPRDCS